MRLARKLTKPLRGDLQALHRLARYLLRTGHYRQHLRRSGTWAITTHCDADWGGGDTLDRRSVTGGVVFLCGCVLVSFARVQHVTALSSGEAELYAMTRGPPRVCFGKGC